MKVTDWGAYAGLLASERSQYMGGPFDTRAAWGMFCADHAQWDPGRLTGRGGPSIRR